MLLRTLAILIALATGVHAQVTIDSYQKLSDGTGGISGPTYYGDSDPFSYPIGVELGTSLANIGDFDGDGVRDLLAGSSGYGDVGRRTGSAHLLLLRSDGSIRKEVKYRTLTGLPLETGDFAGASVASAGDLDGDGTTDFVIGAPGDGPPNPSNLSPGAIYIMFMKEDGTMGSFQKIASGIGGFTPTVESFGLAMTNVGDLDGNGRDELAVSSSSSTYILFLDASGMVTSHKVVSGFGGTGALANMGNLGGPTTRTTLAIGTWDGDVGGVDAGAVWFFDLDAAGSPVLNRRIADNSPDFFEVLSSNGLQWFGYGLANVGDIDGDGVSDLAVGYTKPRNGSVGANQGMFILRMNSDATIKGFQQVADGFGGYPGPIGSRDYWAASLVGMGDLDGDGQPEMYTGNPGAGGGSRGTLTQLSIGSNGVVFAPVERSGDAGAPLTLSDFEQYGSSLAIIGDIDGDGRRDLAVGAPGYDFEEVDRGSVWIEFINPDGTAKSDIRLTEDITTTWPIPTSFGAFSYFGSAIADLGNLDGLAAPDIAIGAPRLNTGNGPEGGVFITFLQPDGKAYSGVRITEGESGFNFTLDPDDLFGAALAAPEDINGDGVMDLLVGAPGDDDSWPAGESDQGGVWVLFLNAAGNVAGVNKISERSALPDFLSAGDAFGSSIASIGDLNRDGIRDIAIGAPGDDDTGIDSGAAWIFLLNGNGTPKAKQKINATVGGFGEDLPAGSRFGASITGTGDLNLDGTRDLIVGAPGDPASPESGAAFILYMNPDGTVWRSTRIEPGSPGFPVVSDGDDRFGEAVAFTNQSYTMFAGAPGDDVAGRDRGAVYALDVDSRGPVVLETRAWLQGADLGGSMRTLPPAVGDFPESQPFSAAPWSYTGLEKVPSPGPAVSDWVLVELRETPDGPSVARRAAFIESDGSIVETNGASRVRFEGVPSGEYYVIIRHRSHLAIISQQAVFLQQLENS